MTTEQTKRPTGMTPEERDHVPVNRGKYRGKTPSEIGEIDAWYVCEILALWDDKPASEALIADCRKDLEQQNRGRD